MILHNQTDELYHFGVPGMKWGVRKIKEARQNHSERKKKNKNS